MNTVSSMVRADILPQVGRPNRRHGSYESCQRASGEAAGHSKRILNSALIGAEHRRNVLEFVPSLSKEARSLALDFAQFAGSNDTDDVKKHPRFGEPESGHRFTSFMVTVVSPKAALRGDVTQGSESLDAIRSPTRNNVSTQSDPSFCFQPVGWVQYVVQERRLP